jgi:hypothetical protein
MSSSSGFVLVGANPLRNLDLDLAWYRHPSGACHLHLACDDAHRASAVAFRTQPDDDTGLPHILEHTVLCGSRRYPVRDPFFMMLRRSLQTFMNAFTYPDRTVYPFATQVRRDFDNLLDVYLDAVFAPRLTRLDFAQEGWRLEPDGDGGSLHGVVLNEMKGAMGNTEAQMADALPRHLLPDSCYRFNSGGDPRAIPRLAHADLVAFHRSRYGAANACFATYGDLDLGDLQRRFAARCRRHPGNAVPVPALQPPFDCGAIVEVPVPHDPAQDLRDVSACGRSWGWGDAAVVDDVYAGRLLDHLCFGHPGAPLRLALESSGLGRSIGGSGYSDHCRNGIFTIALNGILPEDYPRFDRLLDEQLTRLAADGFAEDAVAAAIDHLELQERHIGGNSTPFGLQLCLRGIAAWNFGRPPGEWLDPRPALARLRASAADRCWLAGLVSERLLANRHQTTLRARADDAFHARQQAAERELVAHHLTGRNAAQRAALRRRSAALTAHQQRVDDPGVLPRLARDDIPARRCFPALDRLAPGLTTARARTNGVLDQTIALALTPDPTAITTHDATARCVGELGCGDLDYVAFNALLDRCCGGLHASHSLLPVADDPACYRSYLVVDCHGLEERFAGFADLVRRVLAEARFDEGRRLQELHAESLDNLQSSVSRSGHRLAIYAAMHGAAGPAGLAHDRIGLGRLRVLKRLLAELGEDADAWARQGAVLARTAAAWATAPVAQFIVTSGDPAAAARIADRWRDRPAAGPGPVLRLPATAAPPPTAYLTATAVSYNALVLPAVPITHPDAPALAVAAQLVSQRFLHRRIREQGGAYGVWANYVTGDAHLHFATYRDPRIDGSLDDFAAAGDWLRSFNGDREAIDEAVLAIIAEVDTPGSPAGEARRVFTMALADRTPADLNAYRQGILAVDADAIRRVAATYFRPADGRIACITSRELLAGSARSWETVEL